MWKECNAVDRVSLRSESASGSSREFTSSLSIAHQDERPSVFSIFLCMRKSRIRDDLRSRSRNWLPCNFAASRKCGTLNTLYLGLNAPAKELNAVLRQCCWRLPRNVSLLVRARKCFPLNLKFLSRFST